MPDVKQTTETSMQTLEFSFVGRNRDRDRDRDRDADAHSARNFATEAASFKASFDL